MRAKGRRGNEPTARTEPIYHDYGLCSPELRSVIYEVSGV